MKTKIVRPGIIYDDFAEDNNSNEGNRNPKQNVSTTLNTTTEKKDFYNVPTPYGCENSVFLPGLGMLNENQARDLNLFIKKKEVEFAVKSADKQDTKANKIAILDKIEEKRQLRMLYSDTIAYDKNGELLYIRLDPNKKIVGGTTICDVKDLHLVECIAHKGSEVFTCYIIRFNRDSKPSSIVISESSLTAARLVKILKNAGVHVNMNRDTKESIPSLLLSLLRSTMTVVEVPFTTGWQFINDGWKWINEEKINYLGLDEYAK